MLQPLRSDDVIEALVMMNCGDSATVQARHLFRESLRSLVRLAKMERGEEPQHHYLLCLHPMHDETTLH